jgi:hypothetical protein
MLKKTFVPKRDEVAGNRNCTMRRFMICALRQILFGRLNQEERDGRETCQARALVGKLEGKKALGIWEYTIRIYF